MSLPMQRVFAGRLEAAYQAELARMTARGAIEKIWTKQPELWKPDEAHAAVVRNRLGWVDVVERMRAETEGLRAFAAGVRDDGFRDVVLLGMGGSSLAPEVFSLVFAAENPGRFFVLDSTDPGSILAVERAVDLRHALFIVASKSGKTIETLSQFHYFRHAVENAGVRPAGRSFVAITDAGSYLEQLAAEYSFRRTFLNPADIGGRYSAHSYFGLVPAALCGVDLDAVLDSTLEMRRACGPGAPAESNPALALGALVGAAALNSADKLVLLATPSLASLGNWIEQLVAESTGKEGKGVVPIAGAVTGACEVYAEGCAVVALALEGEDRRAMDAAVVPLTEQGVPVVEVLLYARDELGAEFFKWEAATAVAGAVLGINPFDEPNVQESKDNTSRILDAFQATGRMPAPVPHLTDSGVEVYVEGPLRHRISSAGLDAALRTFLMDCTRDDYVALLAFVDRNASNAARLEALREPLGRRVPTLVGYGPRYLHSIGQLYKGGPPGGLFLVFTAADAEDVRVPGAKYTFGQLKAAQALGDMEALVRRGKPAMRLHLGRGVDDGLARVERALAQALAAGPAREP